MLNERLNNGADIFTCISQLMFSILLLPQSCRLIFSAQLSQWWCPCRRMCTTTRQSKSSLLRGFSKKRSSSDRKSSLDSSLNLSKKFDHIPKVLDDAMCCLCLLKLEKLMENLSPSVDVEVTSFEPAEEPGKTAISFVSFDSADNDYMPLLADEQLDYIKSLGRSDLTVKDQVIYWEGMLQQSKRFLLMDFVQASDFCEISLLFVRSWSVRLRHIVDFVSPKLSVHQHSGLLQLCLQAGLLRCELLCQAIGGPPRLQR